MDLCFLSMIFCFHIPPFFGLLSLGQIPRSRPHGGDPSAFDGFIGRLEISFPLVCLKMVGIILDSPPGCQKNMRSQRIFFGIVVGSHTLRVSIASEKMRTTGANT